MSAKPTSYDLSQCLGFEYPPEAISWNQRDTILYALSIGAHNDDFPLIYEKTGDKFRVFPTFAATLSFKGTDTDVFDFASKFGGEAKPPGLPEFDTTKLVQASQYVEALEPLPKVSGDGWTVTKKVVGVHEGPEGVTLDNELTIIGPDKKPYSRLIAQAKYLGAKANGVPYDNTMSAGFPAGLPINTLGRPTWTAKGPTWPTQSVLYRLNGDYNPLHIDPKVGKALGYGGLICHGLGMYAITARALVERLGGNDPDSLKAITALFSGPITPGDTLKISIWDLGPGPSSKPGTTTIAFEARAASSNALCLGEGRAYLIKGAQSSIAAETDPTATAYVSPSPAAGFTPANGPVIKGLETKGPKIMGVDLSVWIGLVLFVPGLIFSIFFAVLQYLFTGWYWRL